MLSQETRYEQLPSKKEQFRGGGVFPSGIAQEELEVIGEGNCHIR